jgi:hypothetical protein
MTKKLKCAMLKWLKEYEMMDMCSGDYQGKFTSELEDTAAYILKIVLKSL